jgi:hypothetical protein
VLLRGCVGTEADVATATKLPPFLGASAPWVDDAETTYAHTRRQVADHLRAKLLDRIAVLDQTEVSTEEVTVELRRQMAACAVDGNLLLASDLGEAVWDLLQWRESGESL